MGRFKTFLNERKVKKGIQHKQKPTVFVQDVNMLLADGEVATIEITKVSDKNWTYQINKKV